MNRTAYKNRHIKEHYDRINLVIPKGEMDRIKNVCSEMGESVNEYLLAISTEQAINRLYSTYSKYGITKELITSLFVDGIEKQGFTPLATYNLLRMSLGNEFNEREYFSLEDVMVITGESREELLQRIEQCRQELTEAGENPDDYFKPVEPQRATVYYLPDGLH